jgi:CHAT domain-containing protein/tetratricopeptide (TPR) repeat protein
MKKLIFLISFLFTLFLFYPYLELFSLEKDALEQEYQQLFAQAEKSRLDGKFDESVEKFLFILRKINDKEKQCQSLQKLGLLYWNADQIDQSEKIYNQALSIAKESNLEKNIKECQYALEIQKVYKEGNNFFALGEYQKSIETFKKAIALADKINSAEHKLKCFRKLSRNYWQLNDIGEFHSLNEAALKIAKDLNHKKEQGRCLINIGLFYWKLNNYSKALTYYEKALKIAQEEKNKQSEGECFTNIGLCYLELGNFENALECFEEALLIDKEMKKNDYISVDFNNLGALYRRMGLLSRNEKDFNKALNYFYNCLEITKETKDIKTETRVLNNIGSIYSEIGSLYSEQEKNQEKYIRALKYFESGLKKAEEIPDPELMGIILTNIGVVYYNQGKYEESTKCYEKVINLVPEREQILWETYMESARAYEKQNQLEKALQCYKWSIKFIEGIRRLQDLEEFKAKYLGTEKRIDAYHYFINFLINFSQSHSEKEYQLDAFNYLERAKARSFLERLEISQIDITQGVDPELLNQEKELEKDLSNLYIKLLPAELAPEEKNIILKQIKEKENEIDTFELEIKSEMRINNPAYADLLYPEIITIKEIQERLLDNNTVFFEYCIGKEHSYAFVITKKDLKIFPIPKRDEIKKSVSGYLTAISNKDNNNFQAGYELFKTIILPGLEKNIKTIIFIPDDVLHILPFETLITNKGKNEWLIKNYKIAYAPSLSSLREIIQRKKSSGKKPQKDILAIGDPYFGLLETDSIPLSRLKYSGLEVDIISTLFSKSKQKIFLRENASEEQLKNNNLAEYKIIHFATHSIINNNNPSQSTIVLSRGKDPNEDGFLWMREIYNLKLNSDLVTLSACETGLGELIHGEGIVGLNKGFFYAGTSAVLMSLWAVNDQASCQLMERFYRHLKSSESIMDALRKVKLEMIDSGVLSHPYYWAGFIVSGKADEIIFPKSTSKWLLIGVSLVLAGGIIFAAVRSFKQRF